MLINRWSAAAAALALGLTLSACGGSASDGAASVQGVAEDLLAMPAVDDTDGLVLDGEQVADAKLLAAARAEDRVVFYTASGAESAELTAARFEAETGVKVEMTRLPSGKLAERVLSESGADRLQAGVVTITDPVIAEEFAANGVYVPYEVPMMAELSAMDDIVWNDGQYYTSYYSAYAFAYNTELVTGDDVPSGWTDLLDQKWSGKLGVVNAGAGGTVQGLAQFQDEKIGGGYLDDLAAQEPRIFDTTSPQLEALARGEISVATAGFNSTFGAQAAGAPIKLVVPSDGISGSFNMQGLTPAGLKSPSAKLFMNWSMSKAGQRFAAAQGFVGARTDIEQVPTGEYQLPAADDPTFTVYTPDDARTLGAGIVARWNKIFSFNG